MTAADTSKDYLRGRRGPTSKLAPWQISYIRRAWKIRRNLTNSAIAQTLGLTEKQVRDYAGGLHKQISVKGRLRGEAPRRLPYSRRSRFEELSP